MAKTKIFSREEADQIKEDSKDKSYQEIANDKGCSRKTIYRILKGKY